MVFGLRINNKAYLLIALIYLMTNAVLYSNKIDSEFYQWSKIVVSGDTTQTDLPSNQKSGLTDAVQRLKDIKGIKIVTLGKEDIVRHRLVQDIVLAYDKG